MRLITIAFSHYNERARWALDLLGADYREQAYLPLFHFLPVMLATRGAGGRADAASSRYSTPVLVTDEGQRICDSTEILRYACERFGTLEATLYPPEHRAEIEALEEQVRHELGSHTRRVAYFHVLREPGLLQEIARANVGPVQATAFNALSPLLAEVLRKALRIDPPRAEASLHKVRERAQQWSERLGGRRYLVGDRFTAADLTTACMLAPVLAPTSEEGYGASLPGLDRFPPPLRGLVQELRDTPIGAFALRMFAEERPRRGPTTAPAPAA